MELKDWLNSINMSKENLIDEDPELEKEYAPYIINKCLAGQLDSVLYANEMNMHHHLDKKMQYDFYKYPEEEKAFLSVVEKGQRARPRYCKAILWSIY